MVFQWPLENSGLYLQAIAILKFKKRKSALFTQKSFPAYLAVSSALLLSSLD